MTKRASLFKMDNSRLIARFVKTFPVFGEVSAVEFSSELSWVAPLTARLPARFPSLYEQLILSYRWSDVVDLGSLRLLPNPGRTDFAGLAEAIFRDTALVESLIPGGFIQFGMGPDTSYDSVCFDVRGRRRNDGDCRVVRLDHEEILCDYRIREVEELAPSFRELMMQIIADASWRR